MLQLERTSGNYKDEITYPNRIEEEFTLIKSLPVQKPRVLQATTGTTLPISIPPITLNQTRTLQKTRTTSTSTTDIGIALTKEAFPLHCKSCNRTVVTEPIKVASWSTWGMSMALAPVFMCVVPWWRGWGCRYHHRCGRCEKVLAIYQDK